jgi:DNA-binding Lrp family transcriptional regulator
MALSDWYGKLKVSRKPVLKKGGGQMATKAYFMVDVEERFCQNGYRDILKDLEAIPEVESVERVTGACDLLVKVDAPIRMVFVANKLLAKKWVKHLHVLHVEPIQTDELDGLNIGDLMWLKRVTPTEAVR